MNELGYVPGREHRQRPEEDEPRRPQAAPGKRTLTMSLGRRPVQAKGIDMAAATRGDLSAIPTGGGTALPAATRKHFESSFGADLSSVRIHHGDAAGQLGAKAFTHGEDIHFGSGNYDPHSDMGKALLGHELTHVIQQRSGAVSAQGKGGIINADASLEAEADVLGARAARGEAVSVAGACSGGFGVQRADDEANPGAVATELLSELKDEIDAGSLVGTVAEQAAAKAVEAHLMPTVQSIANKMAAKEADKLQKLATNKGKGRQKGGGFKKAIETAAEDRARDLVTNEAPVAGDDAGRIETRADATGKEAGRAAAADAAVAIASAIASEVTSDAKLDAINKTKAKITSQALAAVTGATASLSSEMLSIATMWVEDGNMGGDIRAHLKSKMAADALERAVADAALDTAASAAAKRFSSATKRQVKQGMASSITAGHDDNKEAVEDKAIAAGKGAISQVNQKGVAEAGVGPKMAKLASFVESIIPDAGDLADIDIEIAIPASPGVFVNLHMVGSVQRAGGAGAVSESFVTTKMEMLLGASGGAGIFRGVGEMGGYVESCGPSAGHAFEQISYSLFRRFRQSDLIPAKLVDAMWSSGGLSADDWAEQVEQRMADADVQDDGSIRKRAYVESGVKVGGRAEIDGGDVASGKVGVHVSRGTHLRPEKGDENAEAAVPSKHTTSLLGKDKEKKGRKITAYNFTSSLDVGKYAGGGVNVGVKVFDKDDAHPETEVWTTVSGTGKLKGVNAENWYEFVSTSVSAISALIARARLVYEEKVKGENQVGIKARERGAYADAAFSGLVGGIHVAQANAKNAVLDTAADVLGAETTMKVTYEKRGSDEPKLTIDLFQAKTLSVGASTLASVGGAKAKMGMSKRMFQLTLLPGYSFECPAYDKKGD
jgi:hypothetical protein